MRSSSLKFLVIGKYIHAFLPFFFPSFHDSFLVAIAATAVSGGARNGRKATAAAIIVEMFGNFDPWCFYGPFPPVGQAAILCHQATWGSVKDN